MGVKCGYPVLLHIKMFEETTNYELFDKAPFEKLHLRFCEYIRNLATSPQEGNLEDIQ